MASPLFGPICHGPIQHRTWSIVLAGILLAVLTASGNAIAAPRDTAPRMIPLPYTITVGRAQMAKPRPTTKIRSRVPATPSTPRKVDGQAGAASFGDPITGLAWSLIYSGLIALAIACSGLLFVGSRRRLW